MNRIIVFFYDTSSIWRCISLYKKWMGFTHSLSWGETCLVHLEQLWHRRSDEFSAVDTATDRCHITGPAVTDKWCGGEEQKEQRLSRILTHHFTRKVTQHLSCHCHISSSILTNMTQSYSKSASAPSTRDSLGRRRVTVADKCDPHPILTKQGLHLISPQCTDTYKWTDWLRAAMAARQEDRKREEDRELKQKVGQLHILSSPMKFSQATLEVKVDWSFTFILLLLVKAKGNFPDSQRWVTGHLMKQSCHRETWLHAVGNRTQVLWNHIVQE